MRDTGANDESQLAHEDSVPARGAGRGTSQSLHLLRMNTRDTLVPGTRPFLLIQQRRHTMKLQITLIAVICFVGAALGQQAREAPKPGPEHQKLGIWVGDWQYEGQAQDSPIGPGGKFSGKGTCRWILDGFFTEWRAEEKGNLGDLVGIELAWYDAAAKNYPYQGYLSNGDVYSDVQTVSGNVWNDTRTLIHNGRQYKCKQVFTFAADGMSYTWRSEISTDGKTWAPWAEGKGTKVASASVEQELIKLENGWSEAMVKKDLAFLDRILANEFTETDAEGTVWTKAQELAVLTSGEFKCTSAVADDMQVRVYGDTAVATGRNTNKAQLKGKDISGQHRWTDTWIKRDGRWQCVATQATRIVEK